MFNENPKIWFTPGAVTRKNEPALTGPLNPPLSITEAEDIFRELARRKIIEDIYPTVEYVGKSGEVEKEQISAWRVNRDRTSKTSAWIESRGIVANGFLPLWNFFPSKWVKLGLLAVFLIGAFVTGFLTRSGELLSESMFSSDTSGQPQKAISAGK